MLDSGQTIDCENIVFSSLKSHARIGKASKVVPASLLARFLALALYLLGATRKAAAGAVPMPEQSLKALIHSFMTVGIDPLMKVRPSEGGVPPVPELTLDESGWRALREEDSVRLQAGALTPGFCIPVSHPVQLRTIVLSLVNSGCLSFHQASDLLQIGETQCRTLAERLASQDVDPALVDKRSGQTEDYRVGSELKAEIIAQIAARSVTGQSIASEDVAEAVNKAANTNISPRTIRLHVAKLHLKYVAETVPKLVAELKKNS